MKDVCLTPRDLADIESETFQTGIGNVEYDRKRFTARSQLKP